MIKCIGLVIASALALTSPTSAFGEGRKDPDMPGARWNGSKPATYRSIDRMADCIVKLRFAEVKALLGSSDNKRMGQLATALASNIQPCIDNVALRFNAGILRSALIQSIYRKDVARQGDLISSMPLGSDAGYIEEAKCVVRGNPTEARNFIVSLPGTKEESAAVEALGDIVVGCGAKRPAGLHATQALRFKVAEALYRSRLAQDGRERLEAAK